MAKVRAKIEKVDNRTLAITEIPYGRTTGAVIDSILKAFEKGKIKIRKVDDNTAETALILVHLQPGTSSDKAIDALYAFTDCEVSISPNCCVISDNKPVFLGVSDVLRHSVDTTLAILRNELEIRLGELREQLLFASLERIFIEQRIYKDDAYEQAPDIDAAVAHIDSRLEPYKGAFVREITRDDILRLLEIKMKRILRFSAHEADEAIAALQSDIADTADKLDRLTDHAIAWYENLKNKYGEAFPRRTIVRNFDNIAAANVAEANEKLYINREEGFIGTSLKKDEFICNCSLLDEVIIFYKDGRYKVVKVQEKHRDRECIQAQRFTYDIQRHIPERTRRRILHEALCRDRTDARPRIQPHAWTARHTRRMVLGQSQRRSRGGESGAETQSPARETAN